MRCGARGRLAALIIGHGLVAAAAVSPAFATFSIVARDSATGDLGVAVSTRAPAVGAVVPWAKAGIGAVATQASTNPEFGPKGLALLEQGTSPRDTLARLLVEDDTPEKRQIGIVDAKGGVASHTGRENIPYAGAIEGVNFTAQGNLLVGRETLEAMAASFRGTEGKGLPLAERLLRALEAGQAAGGDRRGRQSAALLVVTADPQRRWERSQNLRVDDHANPVAELRRIYETVTGRLGYRDLSRPAGRDVRELQELLRRAGLYDREPDGSFDDATVAAVQAFRKAQGLDTGEYGGPVALVDADLIARLRTQVQTREGKAPP
ncbi:MAG TPA: DUF1028 domain-containing protein [Candidatus Polarisedimenticolia bacterium]|jgi:uncharacterized Ntn-hydrolase superfamily protein